MRCGCRPVAGWMMGVLALVGGLAQAAPPRWDAKMEEFVVEPLPAEVTVVNSELEGPVYADSRGMTLYSWRGDGVRGDAPGKAPTCGNTRHTVTTEEMRPYPPGLALPDSDARPSCSEVWPPLIAPAGAKPVGEWTIVTRKEGAQQWAYKGLPVHTSILDTQPRQTSGGRKFRTRIAGVGAGLGDSGNFLVVGPTPVVPPRFRILMMGQGHMVALDDGYSVYAYEKDRPHRSNCTGACADQWVPVLAPEALVSKGDWSAFERSPGVYQWAFRKWPLYRRPTDRMQFSREGSDIPGWHNVFTHLDPPAPDVFKAQDAPGGIVLADSRGRTLYYYVCLDPAPDHQFCDHPAAPQVYRFAICGKFDPVKCVQNFPYVVAAPGARSRTVSWSTMWIDPATGKRASQGQRGALHVWAFRNRPVYLSAMDRSPGDVEADWWGDHAAVSPANGAGRNWFKAFWLRDDFYR